MKRTILTLAACLGVFAALAKPAYNDNEEAIPPYTLPDVLTLEDGRKVTDRAQWAERRREILNVFEREMYGRMPPAPEAVVTEVIEQGVTLDGMATRRQVRMWFRRDKSGPFLDWLLVTPRYAKGPVPVLEYLNYYGNHELLDDLEVKVPEGDWVWSMNSPSKRSEGNKPVARTRGSQVGRMISDAVQDLPYVISRGYAVLTACYGQVSPDTSDLRKARIGVFTLWPPADESRTDNTTALGAWSWALRRGMDFIEREPALDARRVVVTGCSRLGKSALIAGAWDERFAVVAPNQTGGGGAPLAKRFFGENVATEMEMFPHWYCAAYGKYAGNEAALPFDQHWLQAAVAPRALLVTGFNMKWFDTKGEWLAARAAAPVWRLFGKDGLPDGDFPENFSTAAIGTWQGYVRRTEDHGFSLHDVRWILDFADGVWAATAAGTPSGTVPRETQAIQARIDAASAAGGGRVTIPAGRHVTGTLFLKDNVELHLAKGAVLEGSDDPGAYPPITVPFSEVKGHVWYAAVAAVDAKNVSVTGEGEFFGNGANFLPKKWNNLKRPRGFLFLRCTDVKVEGVTLRDAASWMCYFKRCDGVTARRVKISNFVNKNNDGFDVDSRNVLIEDCEIESEDDAICLKSDEPGYTVENVTVRRCRAASRCNALKLGTGTHGNFRNVVFEDCEVPVRVRGAERGPGHGGISFECVDGGSLTDVHARNVRVAGVQVPFFIRLGNRPSRGCGIPRGEEGVLSDVSIENCTAVSASPIASSITGVPGFRVRNVLVKDVSVTVPGHGDRWDEKSEARPVLEMADGYPEATMFGHLLPAHGFYARHVDGLRYENVRVTVAPGGRERRPAFFEDDCTGVIR